MRIDNSVESIKNMSSMFERFAEGSRYNESIIMRTVGPCNVCMCSGWGGVIESEEVVHDPPR